MADAFWMQGMMVGHRNAYDCIKEFSESDFTEDLKKFDVPTLIVHGSDDQIVPIDAAGRTAARLVRGSIVIVYDGHAQGPTQHRPAGRAEVVTSITSDVTTQFNAWTARWRCRILLRYQVHSTGTT